MTRGSSALMNPSVPGALNVHLVLSHGGVAPSEPSQGDRTFQFQYEFHTCVFVSIFDKCNFAIKLIAYCILGK